MGLDRRGKEINSYRTGGHATDHPVDNITSQKQKLDFNFLFVYDSFCPKSWCQNGSECAFIHAGLSQAESCLNL